MKVTILLGLLWLNLVTAAAPSLSSKPNHLPISGTEPVRLEDWARANGLQCRWTTPKQELKINNSVSALVFTVDSRKCSINGIQVWLSAPVAMHNGAAWIASVDLATAVRPVLFSSKSSPGKVIKNIVLDPGHGGKDPGNRESKQQEKRYTLLLAKELADLLSKAGFKVSLTRNSDSFVELPNRPEIARRRGADLFVSLHFNSADGAGGSSVQGTEIYCLTPAYTSSTNARGEGANTGSYPGNRFDAKNMLLAYQIQKALVKNLSVEDRGVRRARFAVLRSAEMPAVLIEGGFMTHPAESKKIYDAVYRQLMAQTIADGVLAYKRAVEQ